jgi:nitroreductase
MLELLRKRRSIRQYQADPVDADKIAILKEAVLRAPSSGNRKPCRFFFVTDAGRIGRLSQAKLARGSAFLANAPLTVVVCGDETVSDVWIEDCSIASTILHLTAESLGLGSCWCQIRKRSHNEARPDEEQTAEDYVREVLGITPPLRVHSIVAIGLPDKVKADPHPFAKLNWEAIIQIPGEGQ